MAGTNWGGCCNRIDQRRFTRGRSGDQIDAGPDKTKSAITRIELALDHFPVPKVTDEPSDHRFHEAPSGLADRSRDVKLLYARGA
jgi:hypothetical protein